MNVEQRAALCGYEYQNTDVPADRNFLADLHGPDGMVSYADVLRLLAERETTVPLDAERVERAARAMYMLRPLFRYVKPVPVLPDVKFDKSEVFPFEGLDTHAKNKFRDMALAALAAAGPEADLSLLDEKSVYEVSFFHVFDDDGSTVGFRASLISDDGTDPVVVGEGEGGSRRGALLSALGAGGPEADFDLDAALDSVHPEAAIECWFQEGEPEVGLPPVTIAVVREPGGFNVSGYGDTPSAAIKDAIATALAAKQEGAG